MSARRRFRSLHLHPFAPPVLVIFAVTLVLLILTMDRRLDLYDEGMILTAAMRIRAGDMPHRDFYFVYGPAGPWILAKLWSASPVWFLIERAYDIIIQSAIAAVGYRLLRSRMSPPFSLCFVAVCLAWLISWQNYPYPSFASVLLALIGASLLLSRNVARPRPGMLILAGGCAGMATLFRYDVGLPIMSAQGAYILLLGRCDVNLRVGLVAIGRELALMALGFAVVIAPIVWMYWQGGVFHDWWRDVVTSATTYYVSHRAIPFPTPLSVLRKPVLAAAYLPIAVIVIGIVTLNIIRRDNPAADDLDRRKLGMITASLAIALYYKGMVRSEPHHFLMSIVPSLLTLTLCIDRLWGGGRRWRGAAVAAIVLAVVPPAYGAATAMRRMMWDPSRLMVVWLKTSAGMDWRSDQIASCERDLKMFGAWLPREQAAMASFVRDHSRTEDRLLVTTDRIDRFIVNSPALYFAAGRQPGTHWYIYDPGLQTRADIQAAMIRDLAANDVRWIIYDTPYKDVREPNASSISSHVHLLDRWIGHSYRPVAESGAVSVWLRKGDVLPARRCVSTSMSATATAS